jgi:plastocyanin
MSMRRLAIGVVLGGALVLAGCPGGDDPDHAMPTNTGAPAAAAGGVLTPDPGGKVITVEMETDGMGNFFEPAEFEANQGDVIRFMLVTGVHNANFLPDSNPPGTTLPPATPLLQLPGQTYDVKVEMAPGRYYFQCDPHALLGMIGYVTVK